MFVFVDTETTGFPRGGVQPRIVSIAWMPADTASAPRVSGYSVVRPDGFAIPAGAAAVHGISTERALAEGRPLRDVLADFAADIGTLRPRSLVAHNAKFDIPIIEAEFARIGRPNPCLGLEPVCTMLTARRRWPGESARLGAVCHHLFGTEMRDAHNAGADVRACAQVFFALHGSEAAPASTGQRMSAGVSRRLRSPPCAGSSRGGGSRSDAAAAQAPAMVSPSTRTVGASVPRRNCRSSAGVRWRNMSFRLPAMVISLTGSARAPSRIMKPAAPRL